MLFIKLHCGVIVQEILKHSKAGLITDFMEVVIKRGQLYPSTFKLVLRNVSLCVTGKLTN